MGFKIHQIVVGLGQLSGQQMPSGVKENHPSPLGKQHTPTTPVGSEAPWLCSLLSHLNPSTGPGVLLTLPSHEYSACILNQIPGWPTPSKITAVWELTTTQTVLGTGTFDLSHFHSEAVLGPSRQLKRLAQEAGLDPCHRKVAHTLHQP